MLRRAGLCPGNGGHVYFVGTEGITCDGSYNAVRHQAGTKNTDATRKPGWTDARVHLSGQLDLPFYTADKLMTTVRQEERLEAVALCTFIGSQSGY